MPNGLRVVYRSDMTTLHLVDGTYELFRNHFGAPPRETPEGWEIGAVAGLMSSTLSLLASGDVTHIGAAFDSVIESFRNEMFDGYKTGEGTPPELYAQFPVAERAMVAMGIAVWSMIEFEADDGMASAAAKFVDEVDRVVIMSPDKDMTQLLSNPKIVTYDRRKGVFLDADGTREKFGVSPESIPDYLGLVGDTSDGIPGLPGWGAKSAGSLLARYGHLDSIPESADDWDVKVRSAEKLAETLRTRMEEALLYRQLAILRTDADIPQTLDDLEWKGVDREPFELLCDELGFTGLKSRPSRWLNE